MRKTSLIPLLILLAACGDGGGSGPTEPTPTPPPTVNIQGVWTGTASTLSARGTCLADSFQPVTVPAVWTFQQIGSSVTATEVLNNAQVCGYTGTVRGSTVELELAPSRSQAVCSVQNLACPGPRPVRVELITSRSIVTGAVSGNRLIIVSNTVWRAVEVSTGNSLGDYEITARQELTK